MGYIYILIGIFIDFSINKMYIVDEVICMGFFFDDKGDNFKYFFLKVDGFILIF